MLRHPGSFKGWADRHLIESFPFSVQRTLQMLKFLGEKILRTYRRAKSDWLKKREDAQTYLETGNNGMISLCGYVKDGCMDDCFIGITIGYIEKL